jgi:nitrate reductase gamma subunit
MRKFFGAKKSATGLPKQGQWSFYILGGIFLAGYIVKGMRIAMTGFPAGSEIAFLSYGIAMLFRDVNNLTELYGYIWYVHAILVGLFVACLPFSRMSHIIMGPVAVFVQAMQKKYNCF